MAQTQGHPDDTAPPVHAHSILPRERLRRYVPPELVDAAAGDMSDLDVAPNRIVEAFVHLAASRYTITTYLPRLLVHQLLGERLVSPWLRWVEGSLLFADLSGSTALAEQLSALGREGTELVTDFLNHIFETMIQVIQSYGGDLVAFGGDALLVFFGDERHPRTATRAALALQDALHGYVKEVPGVGVFPMHLHVGVESGRLAFVSAGQPHALYYSVLGATVNGVAAAEGHAHRGEVVVGPAAWATLAEYAQGEEVAPGFFRISIMRPPTCPHEPLAEQPVMTAAPEAAIPHLLDDLDRISPYVPPVLLNRILAAPQLPQVEADLRPVTMLFAQAIGLERLAESLPPEPAAQAVQIYVSMMQAAIEQFGGVVNKIDVADEGIKLVAIFGAPAAYEDHAERAARAALEMQAQLDEVNRQITQLVSTTDADDKVTRRQGDKVIESGETITLSPLHPVTVSGPEVVGLRQRIGLNLGTAFAGNVGSAVRKEYTVMGDAVNVAARVMSKTDWDEVWCSAAAAQAIESRMVCEPRGEVAVKGKAQPLPLFRLRGERDTPAAAPLDDEGPLVGREAELAWLHEHLHSALDGAGRAVRIAGDAGVGKSRLTAALVEAAAAHGARVIPAACFSYTASIPYAAWAEWLKALCGIVSGDDDDARIRKISARLAELGPGMEEWLPLLGDLARLDVPDNRLTRGLDPQMRQTRRFELLEQLLLRAAEEGPIIALFEDLHWADPISLDLWWRVAGALDGRPVLLLGVHRPSSALANHDNSVHVLELKELSAEQSGDLIATLAGDAQLPEPLVRQLVERSSGNPLFLAELLRAILAKKEIRDWRLEIGSRQSQIPNVFDDLPDSLNGLLLSRIDRLDEPSRGLLRVASVIGQRIPFGVLQAIHSDDRLTLLRRFAHLESEDLTVLERPEPPERVHAFRHALIQEVAYQSMLYARRRELHGRIGEYLEQRYGDDLDDYYGLLAHHYRLSDRRDKAVAYLLKAGHAARAVYANEEAMQYYRWALDGLAGDDADLRAWETRDAFGDVLATVGRYEEALAQHAAILAAPRVTADIARRAHRKRGSVLEKQGQYSAALEELDRAMTIARSGVPGIAPLAIPLISADVGLVHKRRGEYDLAIAACEQGLAAIEDDPLTHDDEMIEARLHSELGGIYGMRGDYPRARHHFEHSLRLREEVDDLPGMVASHNNLGYLWQLQSEYERAIEHYHVAEELASKINLRYMIIFAAGNAAYALISLGIYDEAKARCLEALTLSQEINAQHNIAQSHDMLGLIAYHQGQYEQAISFYNKALQIHESLGSAHQEGSTLANIAVVMNAQGRFEEATITARKALDRAESLQGQRLKVEALNALAEAMFGQHVINEAIAYAQESAELSQAIGSKHDGGIAQRLLGQLNVSQNEPFDENLEQSIALFNSIKDRFELARTSAVYGAALIANGNELAGHAYLKQARETFVAIGANGELQRLAPIIERSV